MYTVLVIDDDKDILTVVELILKSNGFKVKSINLWQDTFSSIKSFNPDIILLDIALGGEDGRNISRQIKSNTVTEHIPVVLFSANHNPVKNLQNSLANDFLAKPFEADILVKTLLNNLQMHVA
jgi:DNA-binding response OmpR family regulator